MKLAGTKIGIAFTGSFCTFNKIFNQLEELKKEQVELYPILSNSSQGITCRFGSPEIYMKTLEKITEKNPITTIEDAEHLGPENILDILVIAPCTGNTMAKLANGITDTPVLMAAKGHLRNNKPLVIFLSTNDALGMNLKNIGILLNTKNIYFVPFGQDNVEKKPNSMISYVKCLIPTIEYALDYKQFQPVIQSPHHY